jgi:hypothetical protein
MAAADFLTFAVDALQPLRLNTPVGRQSIAAA